MGSSSGSSMEKQVIDIILQQNYIELETYIKKININNKILKLNKTCNIINNKVFSHNKNLKYPDNFVNTHDVYNISLFMYDWKNYLLNLWNLLNHEILLVLIPKIKIYNMVKNMQQLEQLYKISNNSNFHSLYKLIKDIDIESILHIACSYLLKLLDILKVLNNNHSDIMNWNNYIYNQWSIFFDDNNNHNEDELYNKLEIEWDTLLNIHYSKINKVFHIKYTENECKMYLKSILDDMNSKKNITTFNLLES
jgi:hypothetical protein